MKVPTQPITPVNETMAMAQIAAAVRDVASQLEHITVALGYLNGNVAQILNKMGHS